jgi:5-hydroxyisourate hydrolase
MTMGRLSTHVLDTALGRPAAGVTITLYRVSGNSHRKIGVFVTNVDGRTDAPLLVGADLKVGIYELVFCAGEYLRATGQAGRQVETQTDEDRAIAPLFLDEIPIRFGIADAGGHYHVPLLISPFAYSTYRGS